MYQNQLIFGMIGYNYELHNLVGKPKMFMSLSLLLSHNN